MTTTTTTSPPSHLLLLPPSPWPITPSTLHTAYHTPLAAVLLQLKQDIRKGSVGAVLDIAVPCPYLDANRTLPRRTLYPTAQSLVSGIYRLICLIAAKESINVEDSEGIDVRVLLVAHPRTKSRTESLPDKGQEIDFIGPVIQLTTLAKCQRKWDGVFAVEGDKGQALLHKYLIAQDGHVKIRKVAGGDIKVEENEDETVMAAGEKDDVKEDAETEKETHESAEHYSIAVGGTFDHLHIGHKHLLTMFAFLLPSLPATTSSTTPSTDNNATPPTQHTLTIGTTGDALLTKKSNHSLLQPWNTRQRAAASFLLSILDFRPESATQPQIKLAELEEPGANGHVVNVRVSPKLLLKFVEINDPFGPTITEESITALVVSGETRKGGAAVNDKRVEKGWRELEVFEVDVLSAEDAEGVDGNEVQKVDDEFKNKLSSTSIRERIAAKGEERGKRNRAEAAKAKAAREDD